MSIASGELFQVEWHAAESTAVLSKLNSDPKQGLKSDDAKARLGVFGLNVIDEGKKASVAMLLTSQFKETLVLILMAAVVISTLIEAIESVDTRHYCTCSLIHG